MKKLVKTKFVIDKSKFCEYNIVWLAAANCNLLLGEVYEFTFG